jgi:hypothetical protein
MSPIFLGRGVCRHTLRSNDEGVRSEEVVCLKIWVPSPWISRWRWLIAAWKGGAYRILVQATGRSAWTRSTGLGVRSVGLGRQILDRSRVATFGWQTTSPGIFCSERYLDGLRYPRPSALQNGMPTGTFTSNLRWPGSFLLRLYALGPIIPYRCSPSPIPSFVRLSVASA